MKIDSNITSYNPKFKGLMNNKALLKGLELVSEHSTSFIAGTTLLMASVIRPIVISMTPDVDKENKRYAAVNSFTSGLTKFAIVEAVAIPIENAVKNIDKNPEKFLNPETINNLKGSADKLINSQNYKFATQFFKLASNFITAVPKAMITIALMPLFMDLFFKNKKANNTKISNNNLQNQGFYRLNNGHNEIFAPFEKKANPSFKGGLINNTSKAIGEILNNGNIQNLIKKFSSHNENIARNMTMATDILLTASFVNRTNRSKKIKPERKKALIYNNIISTGISIIGGCTIDKLVKNNTKGFIEKFSKANKENPKLAKYIEGINIIRPTLIFAGIYYGILPLFSTYLADKTDKFINTNKPEKKLSE